MRNHLADLRKHLRLSIAGLLAACLLATAASTIFAAEQQKSADAERIRKTVELLADDDMQGRGLGTNGLDRASGYIGQQFIQMKLKTKHYNGGPFQTFSVRTAMENRHRKIDWIIALKEAGILDDNSKKETDKRDRDAKPTVELKTDKKVTHKKTRTAKIKNVVAVLEGHGPKAEETIVIGAHYDHLGQQREADGELVVFNGANDNASGTAALLEIARTLSGRKEKLPRRIVFIAFSGEEQGLLGSLHYVDHPIVPLKKTIAMINLDMVGCLQKDLITAMGTGCSPSLANLADKTADRHGLSLLPVPLSMPCSDHAPFHAHRVPVIFFATTGGMLDYHTPSDTVEKIDYEGIRRIAAMTSDLAVALAKAEERPKFVNQGFSDVLYRGVVRMLGRTAKGMVTAPDEKKPEKKAP